MSKYNPEQIFFTSDLHFHHKAIISYCNRPWETVEEMNEGLIANWNAKVPLGSTVVIAGDFAMGNPKMSVPILQRLNGQKILVEGNHDKRLIKVPEARAQFVKITPLLELGVQDPDATASNAIQRIVVCHFAMRTWNQMHRGAWHLYGHSHGNLEEDGSRSFDIGADANNWTPLSYAEVKARMASKSFTAVDHHKEEGDW